MTRRKKLLVAVLLPLVLALHAWLLWLGGAWRIFALVEAGLGIMLALVMRDLKKMEQE
ncbi:MAG TPA: hypothetical protein VFU76_14100 [Terriglobales bacterium]|nr:hypothetical protein [Terriglobales bacterium]